jgi:hypothetical protein
MFAYIGSPYSHPDSVVREDRYTQAEQAMTQMLLEGHKVYSPIAMTHHAASKYGMPTESSWWRAHNYAFLGMANELRVLMIDGWHKSIGLADEMNMAKLLDIPISYWQMKDGKWRRMGE